MTFRGEPATPDRQAADWIARLHADGRTEADEASFRDWLRADASHADAFERASSLWDMVGGLGLPAVEQAPAGPPREPVLSRRAVMAGGAVTLAVGSTVLGWREARAGTFQTGVGEQRRLLLEDGSRIMLDTATRVRFRAGPDRRDLLLATGRVDVAIIGDRRPFVIDAGDRLLRSNNARLDVRRDGTRVAFTTIAGSAEVEAVEGHGQHFALRSGQRAAMVDHQPVRLDRPELDDLVAWQRGRLVFREQTLAAAVAEMNRYTTRPLIVADPHAAQLRLSGMYGVGDPEAFARSLAILLPVRIVAGTHAIRILPA